MVKGEVLCLQSPSEKRVKELLKWVKGGEDRHVIEVGRGERGVSSFPYFQVSEENEEEKLHELLFRYPFLPLKCEPSYPKLEALHAERQGQIVDFADLGVRLMRNARANSLRKCFSSEELDLRGRGAIICGAGPSLKKNGVLLKELKERAVLFGGGSALLALGKFGVTPHFAAHIDPACAHAFEGSDTPLLFQLRSDASVVEKYRGLKFLLPGNRNFPLEAWMEEELYPASFDPGWTVGTFCVAAAYLLGCNPIILVGMDLAGEREKHYAPGVKALHSSEVMIPIEGLFSRRDWILARDWIVKFAKEHSDVQWINATEGGLTLEGIPVKKLSEVELAVMEKMPPLGEGKELHLPSIDGSLERARSLLSSLLKEIEGVFPADPRGHEGCARFFSELEKEKAYELILEPIWNLWRPALERQNSDGGPGLYLHRALFFKHLVEEVLK